jgi:hypothetical protein
MEGVNTQKMNQFKKGKKSMKMRIKAVLIIVMVMMVWPVLASAQEKQAETMQFVIEKIRADKQLFVAETMNLTDAEAELFWPVYAKYQDELFLLRANTLGLINAYAKTYAQMSDDTAKRLLNQLMTIEAMGPQLRLTFLPEFQKALPDVKVLRYYQIESKINAALMYELAAKIPLTRHNP